MDLIVVMDGSFSMAGSGNFYPLRSFVANLTEMLTLGPSDVRVGYLEFAGPSTVLTDPYFNQTIGPSLNVTDPIAVLHENLTESILNLTALGGSTNSPGALDFVREDMFTSSNFRPGSKRAVIFATDG